jgi:beta-lactamase superfamily II metal-dependent hydrolase
MAPHHGSRFSNTPELAQWAQPQVVISSQGPPKWSPKAGQLYEKLGAHFLTTWRHGAVTIQEKEGMSWVRTHASQRELTLRK